MRIVIDLQGLQTKASAHRGVGRYTENLVKSLLGQNQKHDFYLALNGALPDYIDELRSKFELLVPNENIVVWQQCIDSAAISQQNRSIIAASEVLREVFLNSFQPDIIFSTNLQEGLFEPAVMSVKRTNFPVLYCSTLHDLVPYYYEKDYLIDPITRRWYLEKIEYAKNSDMLLTDSHSSKKDIVDILKIPEDRVFVVENGYDEQFFKPHPVDPETSRKIAKKYNINKPFLLYVGGNDKHKNIQRLIKAYGMLPSEVRKNYALLLVGKEFQTDISIQDAIKDNGVTGHVITPGFVEDEDLSTLYKSCVCFVFPSTHEGFGLPALEAMACGAPVIGSDSSSIKEIINYKDALFDPFDEKSIFKKIDEVLCNPKLRNDLVINGLQQAKKYSWDDSAKKLMLLWEKYSDAVGVKGYTFAEPVEHIARGCAPFTADLSENQLVDFSRSIAESFPMPGRRKLYIDISVIVEHDYRSGIQRVTRAISGELLKMSNLDMEVQLVYSGVQDLHFYEANSYARRVFGTKTKPHDSHVDFKQGDILVYLDLHPGVANAHRQYNIDLRNKGVSVYHVIYDILPILSPQTFWPELCNEFASWIETVSYADGALCISRAVADEVKAHLIERGEKRATPFKLGWFHLGSDIENSAPTSGFDESAPEILVKLAAKPSFIMVGTLEPRKGHRQTLMAFEPLWNQGLDVNLVIVGKLGWGMSGFEKQIMDHKEYGKHLFWLSSISDEYLDAVYRSATALLAPSDAEGFGLPLIEAARHKIPIIARDIPVFREVAGEHAYYFENNKDPDIITIAISNWLALHAKATHPTVEGMTCLTWSQSAKQLVNVLINDVWTYSIHCQGALVKGSKEDNNSKRLSWINFSPSEGNFRWSNGQKATIGFRWAGSDGKCDLRILCNTFGRQKVGLSLNGVQIYQEIVEGTGIQIICSLPMLKTGYNEINFLLPDAATPVGNDDRQLGLAIREVEMLSFEAVQPGMSENHCSTKLIWKNFSGVEERFRWTDGHTAQVGFRWDEKDGEYTLRLLCNAFNAQRVKIALNKVPIIDEVIAGDSHQFIKAIQSLQKGYNELVFTLPDAIQPGPADKRFLALAFRELEIARR